MGKVYIKNNRIKAQNQGIALGAFTTFNFTGAGVVATDAGNGKVDITIGGSASTPWLLNGNTVGSEKYIGTLDNFDFPIYTNNVRVVTITKAGRVGVGIQVPVGTQHIVTPASDSLTQDTLVLSHLNTGLNPAVETAIRFKVWINNFDNDACRIMAYSTSINSGDQHLVIQTLSSVSGWNNTLDIGEVACKFTNQYYSAKYTLTDGATIALDWRNSNVQYVELGGNRTFTFARPMDGARYIIILKQDGTGSRTVTWPATVLWPGGVAPTLTTTAGQVDIITFVYDGTNTKYYAGSNLNY